MTTAQDTVLQDVVIKFAGDSGDGMQLTGTQFTNNTALLGIDLATFPDFPAEIRAPLGTVPGVSGFQLHFSSDRVYTPGDMCDVLVAMNAAAIKVNIKSLKPGGKLIANTDGFDAKNLRLAGYADGISPLEDGSLHNYEVIKIDVTKLTRESLKDFPELGIKEKDRAKNMFVLGFIYWMYNRSLESTINFLTEKFGKNEYILQSNIKGVAGRLQLRRYNRNFHHPLPRRESQIANGQLPQHYGQPGAGYGFGGSHRKKWIAHVSRYISHHTRFRYSA